MCVRRAECFIIIFSILHLACRKFAHGRTFVIRRLHFFPHVKYIYFGLGVLFRRQKREMGWEKRGARSDFEAPAPATREKQQRPEAAQINFES
jgi:hypothetical protein